MEIDPLFIESELLNKNDTYKDISILETNQCLGAGDGSIMLNVKLSIRTNSGDELLKSIMYKKKRNETSNVDLTEQLCLFKTETLMYDKYLKIMQDVVLNHSKEDEAMSPFVYGLKEDVILMEDLKDSGFSMIKTSQGMDLNHAQLVIKNLAKFHALGMKLIRGGQINPESLQPWWFHRNLPVVDNMFKGGINTLADVIKQEWPTNWKMYEHKLRNAANNLSVKLMSLSHERKEHMLVLNHGDCWSNNIMFRYDTNNSPSGIRFLDFQACHFNSLSWDLTYMLYNCVFPDNRKKWIIPLLDLYSQTLSSLCSDYGCPGKIPSRQDIQQDMDRIIYFGFVNSVNNVPVFIAMDEPDFKFNMDDLASNEESPVAHQSCYYKSDRVTKLMMGDLEFFKDLNVI